VVPGRTRELGNFPVVREMHLKALRDAGFPSEGVFRGFGGQRPLAARLREYCLAKGYDDVAALCGPAPGQPGGLSAEAPRREVPLGFVYLIKSGRFYKIGRSNAVFRLLAARGCAYAIKVGYWNWLPLLRGPAITEIDSG
jgi:hypothetical protein